MLALSLTRERICLLQLLLILVSAVRTRDHILLPQIRDSSNLDGHVPVLYPPGIGWPSYIPRHWVPMDVREVGWGDMDSIDLAQRRNPWRALVNTVMNIRVP
jgi:hypothetical protein